MAKRRPFDPAVAQKEATKFISNYISNTSLGLPEGLDGEAFDKVMGGITRAMAAAWQSGFVKGLDT